MDSFFQLICADLSRLGKCSFRTFLSSYFIPRGGTFPYVFWFRVVQCARRRWWTKWTVAVCGYLFLRHFEFKYGIHANPNIQVGKGLRVVHGGGIYLNCVSIGRNLTVYQGVTLGDLKGGCPTVGDDVTVFPNAVVVGRIRIGNHATIGALSYVAHDVLDGATMVGAPAHLIARKEESKV